MFASKYTQVLDGVNLHPREGIEDETFSIRTVKFKEFKSGEVHFSFVWLEFSKLKIKCWTPNQLKVRH